MDCPFLDSQHNPMSNVCNRSNWANLSSHSEPKRTCPKRFSCSCTASCDMSLSSISFIRRFGSLTWASEHALSGAFLVMKLGPRVGGLGDAMWIGASKLQEVTDFMYQRPRDSQWWGILRLYHVRSWSIMYQIRNFPFVTEVWPHFFTSTRFLNVMHKQNLGCRVKILGDAT